MAAAPDETETLYTYRAGRRVELRKAPDQFVVRAPSDLLPEERTEAVSPASTRVTVEAGQLETAMTEAREIAPTHHAYYTVASDDEFLITDRVLVRFRKALTPEELGAFTAKYALFQVDKFSPSDYLFQLTNHTGMNPVKLVVKLNEDEKDTVEFAEHDLNLRPSVAALTLPTDNFYGDQWHLHSHTSAVPFDARSSSRCEEAWLRLGTFGDENIVVGVTDDGCKLDHSDFSSANKFAGWGYFQGTQLVTLGASAANPSNMYQTGADHGTSCAGVIAGDVNGALIVGAAPKCRLLPVKWESTGPSLSISDSKLLTALNYIADKVDILSNSWGITPRSVWSTMVTDRIRQLAITGGRRQRGILFLWAAGNDNCPIQHESAISVPYTFGWEKFGESWMWVGPKTSRSFVNNLAGIPGVLHVAAVASTAQRSHYSNYGTGIDLCAPSSNKHMYERLDLPGLRITTATGQSSSVTARFGGTSSATPLVAGVAALVLSANPLLSALELAAVLKRTASRDLNHTAWPRTPAASFDPTPVWDVSPVAPFDSSAFANRGFAEGTWSPWFGHGRVDAAAAVDAVMAPAPPVTGVLAFASTRTADIPDNRAGGVRDVIQVSNQGTVSEIEVDVNITHTYSGDLRISLTAPDQTTAVLQNRAGGSTPDVNKTYRGTVLATMAAKSAAGAWTLVVEDLARIDTGTLKGWSMRLRLAAPPVIITDDAPFRLNADEPLVRSLVVPGGKAARAVEIGADVTSVAGAKVQLHIAPPGLPEVALPEVTLDQDQLLRAFRVPVYEGKDPGGVWQLRVSASQPAKLNAWRVEVQ